MPIQCALFENNLTADLKNCAAIIPATTDDDGNDLARDIINPGTTITWPNILAATAARRGSLEERHRCPR